MTATLISLMSIFMGIIGAHLFGLLYKKYSLGLVGNSIAGVFGSVFFVKSFGRFGFDPNYIVSLNYINHYLLFLNLIVSLFAGAIALYLIASLNKSMNK